MQRRALAAAVAALGWQGSALAGDTVEERLLRMESRIKQLEQRAADQDEAIRAKDREIAALREAIVEESEHDTGWFQDVEVGGLVEVEAAHHDPYRGETTSDIVLATAELGLAAQVHDWVAGEVTLLYEEDETDLEVDVATITIAPPDGLWSVKGGQFYLPFGTFETNMVSDPLTLEIGETRETALLAGLGNGGLSAAVYAFNGANNTGRDRIDNWGAILAYALANEHVDFHTSLGYINDIGESDTIQDALTTNQLRHRVPGWTASALIESGPFTLIGEYVAATEDFHRPHWHLTDWSMDLTATPILGLEWTREPAELDFRQRGAHPGAWNLEAGYGFTLAGRPATFALGYQGTEEAFALGLPKRRLLSALSVEIMDSTALSLEWANDRDYDRRDGGTGRSADTLTTQLAIEF